MFDKIIGESKQFIKYASENKTQTGMAVTALGGSICNVVALAKKYKGNKCLMTTIKENKLEFVGTFAGLAATASQCVQLYKDYQSQKNTVATNKLGNQ